MEEKQEILRKLRAQEITVEEAWTRLESVPKPPTDPCRLRATRQLRNELHGLEKVGIEARIYEIDKDVGQCLAGGDWVPTSFPICSAFTTLSADGNGAFIAGDGQRIREHFQVSSAKTAINLTLGQATTMIAAGFLGTSHKPVFVQISLQLTPRPINGDSTSQA